MQNQISWNARVSITCFSSLLLYYLILHKLPIVFTVSRLLSICRLFGKNLKQQKHSPKSGVPEIEGKSSVLHDGFVQYPARYKGTRETRKQHLASVDFKASGPLGEPSSPGTAFTSRQENKSSAKHIYFCISIQKFILNHCCHLLSWHTSDRRRLFYSLRSSLPTWDLFFHLSLYF